MKEESIIELKRRLAEQVRIKVAELNEAANEAESAGLSVYYNYRIDEANCGADLSVAILSREACETINY
jgi:hypothetical protein